MADFSAPSFSLGLDLDLDADPDLSTEEERDGRDGGRREDSEEEGSPPAGPSSSGHQFLSGDEEDDGEDFVLKTLEEDHLSPSPALKRLRRGPQRPRPPEGRQPPRAEPSTPAAPVQRLPFADVDIEALSSQEDCVIRDEYSSRQDHSACSSSKFSLHGQGLLTSPYARKLKAAKTVPPSNGSVPISLEANNNKKVLRRITTSPLRRIQLVDSDSDDLSNHGDKHKDVIEVDSCRKENWFASADFVAKAQWKKTKISSGKLQSENLWKDSSPKKNINLATPALDEFCEEYFQAVKSSNIDQWSKEQTTITSSSVRASDVVDGAESRHEESCISDSPEHNWNLPDPQPPSYQYFYHSDFRIKKLVRQRLPNFVPLGDVMCVQKQQSNAATLDYMSQFGQRKEPFQVSGAREKGLEGNSKCSSRNQKNTKDKKVADTSGPWVNPRNCSAIPKDAGKRLVHAAGHSSGRWYTGQDGRKVYVTRNGQELSGRIAYRHYRKESGAGFRKSRKKASTDGAGFRKSRKKAATAKRKSKR